MDAKGQPSEPPEIRPTGPSIARAEAGVNAHSPHDGRDVVGYLRQRTPEAPAYLPSCLIWASQARMSGSCSS